MTPIPDEATGEPAPRRGRHRKPRPRKIVLAAGGLALAAGVLSLVRVAPESGVGAPGTAEAEPRAGATDHAANTTATLSAAPTARPSATSVMGGSGPTPLATGSPATTPRPTAPTTAPGAGTAPTSAPTSRTPPPGTTPRPTASAPRPAPAPTTHPAPTTPAPSPSTPAQGPGGLCVPVLGLCVNVLGGRT
ncbi:hypothetical protein [Streptomyces sp. NBC_00557]|uniref:hypothetical protein n=1 Tax=Streptomyces sp. NBC_00557 TaxID=2975776 RepID=UPI002E8046B7|nr:hypothetical protein [Streptomyces sp. NBC_00557]WUC35075.1 hypothetical protein OG956_13030 [Streptomyces sp. NBC_00557]